MRADFCPVANHPCASNCEKPCSFSDGRVTLQLQQALDMLCGLAGEVGTDDPMTAAERIFDHVQAERAAHAQELENCRHNLESRNALIFRWSSGMKAIISQRMGSESIREKLQSLLWGESPQQGAKP